MQTEVELKNLVPNPFRHMEHYPIDESKVAELLASYETTGFWGNIVGRRKAGKVEIAYGHHRLVALGRKYRPLEKVPVIVLELSDAKMLKMMASENMSEYGHGGFVVDMESVAAVVEAYAKGQIELEEPERRGTPIRYAPSYVVGVFTERSSAKPYSAQTIAKFLGWIRSDGAANYKVTDALSALEYVELGLIKREAFVGIAADAVRLLLREARNSHDAQMAALARKAAQEASEKAARAKREGDSDKAAKHENRARVYEKEAVKSQEKAQKTAARVIEKVGAKLASGEIGRKQVAGEAYLVGARGHIQEPKLPELSKLVRRLGDQLYELFSPDDVRRQKIEEIAKFRSYTDVSYLVKALEALSKRCDKLIQALNEPTQNGAGATNKTPSPKTLRYELFEHD